MRFPTKTLLLTPLPLWGFIAGWMAADAIGHQWNLHGDAVPMALGTLAAGVLVLVAETIAVNKSFRWLGAHPEQRRPWRYALVGFGIVHITIIVGCIMYAMFFD